MSKDIPFKDLVGYHLLSGVDMGIVQETDYNDGYEDAEAITFVLDGKTYIAVQDPEDGYRSSLRYLKETDAKVVNQFTPCLVRVQELGKDEEGGNCDLLQMIDTGTDKIVLEVGTTYFGEYPNWVGNFCPENITCNAALEDPS